MVTKDIQLKLWENNALILLANQGEVNSRYVIASFQDEDSNNISLSGKTVTFYVLKPDNTQVFNNCTVDTTNNTATVMLTSQMTSTVGILECEFQIFDSNNTLLKANGIKIIVSSKGDFSEAIESTSEFNVLTEAINQAHSISDSVGDMSSLTTTQKGTVVAAINELNSKVIPISQGGTSATTATAARTNLEVRKEFSLYSNSSGTTGTITLSDSYKNYKVIKVYFNDNGVYDTATLYTDMGTKLALSTVYLYTSGTGAYVHSTLIAFSGTSVSFSRNGLIAINENPTIDITLSSDAGIHINKVLGYKY